MKFYTLYPPKLMIVTQYIQIGLPTADLDCDLAQYADIICGKESRKGFDRPLACSRHVSGHGQTCGRHLGAFFLYIIIPILVL